MPPPAYILNPGIEPASLAFPALAGGFFIFEPPGKRCERKLLFLIGTAQAMAE